MKSCQEYQELISRLLDGDLNAQEQDELERHIASCPDCRAMAEAFRALSQTIEEDLEEPDERLHENIMADVRREALRRRQAPKRLRNILALAACAALILLATTNLPRMGSSSPMLAASKASDAAAPQAAITEAETFMDYGVSEEAAAAPVEAESNDTAAARADSAVSAAPAAAPAAGVEMPAPEEAESAPVPEPAPEETTNTPTRASVWLLVLVGLPLISALVLLTLRARRRG